MAEAVCRIDEFEPFGTKCSTQVLFAEAIDAVASKRSITLIDEQVISAERIGRSTVFVNIHLNEPRGFGPQLHLPGLVTFSQDRQGLVLIIIVVQLQIGNLIGSGTRVIEQVQDGIVPEPVFAGNVYALEGADDLLGMQEPD